MNDIREDRVRSVLLDDGWHDVVQTSFKIEMFGFKQTTQSGLEGFSFRDKSGILAGPIGSLLAVRLLGDAGA